MESKGESKLKTWDLTKKNDYSNFKKWYKKSSVETICGEINQIKLWVKSDKTITINLSYVYSYAEKRMNRFSKIGNIFLEILSISIFVQILIYILSWIWDKGKILLAPSSNFLSSLGLSILVATVTRLIGLAIREYSTNKNNILENTKQKDEVIKNYIDFIVK